MAKAFSIRDLMNDTVRQQDSDVREKVSIYDIMSNPDNEYELSEIEKMKDSIFALGGVQQNIVLVKCPENADHKYLALDGHRRLTASRELVAEGYDEFEFIPAVIKGQIDDKMDMAVLVLMNSTQRNKTDWERVMEHMRLKEILPKLKRRQGIDGRTRDIEADMLGVSRAQIGVYNMIGTRLNSDLMDMFRTGKIGISLAYEFAKQESCIQDQIAELARKKGSVTEEDIKQLSGSRACEEQQKPTEIKPAEVNVSDSATSGKDGGALKPDVREIKNVSDSGTFESVQKQPDYVSPESQLGYDASGKSGTRDKEQEIQSSYEVSLIDELIVQYTSYLEMSVSEQREDQISKFNCLLDALKLLRRNWE